MRTIEDVYSLGIIPKSRILVCMPHPDDEAVFLSGTLYELSSRKVYVRVLTFSRGEKSTLRYGLSNNTNLGEVRSVELKNALRILGIEDLKIFDCGDGNLENQEKEICYILRKEIDKYKPTHLITLEPNGIYGHPDHIALSEFVSGISNKSIKTLYATVSPNFILPESASKMAKKKVRPIKPQFELKLRLIGSIKKLLALKSHKSQFRIDILHPQSFLFFLKNKMLTSEFFFYK